MIIIGNYFFPNCLSISSLLKDDFPLSKYILQIICFPNCLSISSLFKDDVPVSKNKYRMSRGECAWLRENVPYVKVYRNNPKRLYPKLNGYGDNGERNLKVWQLLRWTVLKGPAQRLAPCASQIVPCARLFSGHWLPAGGTGGRGRG